MFSEYASRFLAQSQSRISGFVQPEQREPSSSRHDSSQRRIPTARASRLGLPSVQGSPYHAVSRFGFAARQNGMPDAPLFHSVMDDFREEDDETERARETADFYALQRSRRVFAPQMENSVETDAAASTISSFDDNPNLTDTTRGRGIKSSWDGGDSQHTRPNVQSIGKLTADRRSAGHGRRHGNDDDHDKDRMVDVGLNSVVEDEEPPDDLLQEPLSEDSPPAFQKFRPLPRSNASTSDPPRLDDVEQGHISTTIPQSEPVIPAIIAHASPDPPRHDAFWGSLFAIALGTQLATFFLVYLHTSVPHKKLGDTIYTTLHASFHLLAVDTVVSITISMIWLAMLRSFVRPLVYLIILAAPIILISFSLYSLVASFGGRYAGGTLQDEAMRWLSLVPGAIAVLWLYTVYVGRHALHKAIGILEFACKILAANPALLGLGFATLSVVVVWTWIWLGMFTRVFLGGHIAKSVASFIIDAASWWLAVYFVLMYIWTLSIITSIQSSTTAACVSQWYFHRNAAPSPSSKDIVSAALSHATTTIFGTICFATMLDLIVRIPLLMVPRRLLSMITRLTHSLVPSSMLVLTNPLTLTYAAIHSQCLQVSARGLAQMTFLSPQAQTTTLHPRLSAARSISSPLQPYRLAKSLLHITRWIMTLALGFGGWVTTARDLRISMPEGSGFRGSAYAYVVGLVASFIGWAVLGSIEGVLSGIVDASVVCWGSEKAMVGGGAYCLQAGYLFGDAVDRW